MSQAPDTTCPSEGDQVVSREPSSNAPKTQLCAMQWPEQPSLPKQLLSLNVDVLYQICLAADLEDIRSKISFPSQTRPMSTLLSLCSTCRLLREIGAPLVFRKSSTKIVVWKGKRESYGVARRFSKWLSFMEGSARFKRLVKTAHIETPLPGNAEPERLAQMLLQCRVLNELRIHDTSEFRTLQYTLIEGFIGCLFPQVRTLDTSFNIQAIMPSFEHLTRLRITHSPADDRMDELKHYIVEGYLEHVEDLELDLDIYWAPQLLECFNTHLSHLRKLGTVKGGKPGYSFEALFRSGPQPFFPQLSRLSINNVEALGLRYFAPDCDACGSHREVCERHTSDAMRYAAHVAFTACRSLEELWILGLIDSRTRASCERNEDGEVAWIILEPATTRAL